MSNNLDTAATLVELTSLANSIRENFTDHEIIIGLGLESILNVPIRLHGNTLGTMNLLNSADFYNTPDFVCGSILAALLVGPLLDGN